MPASLSEVQLKLSEICDLRRDALDTVRQFALGRIEADKDVRITLVSKFDGYEREFWALVKVERELIASGRIHGVATSRRQTESLEDDDSSPLQNEQRTETRFDAPQPFSAVLTPAAPSGAKNEAREGPRNEAGESAPAASWDDPATAEMVARHYASGDVF